MASDTKKGLAQRQRLQLHVEQHLAWPDLSPRSTAAALGWSVRRVHAALSDGPQTFMRLVTQLRLQRAQQRLREGQGPVVTVAFACGFDSLSTFYRQYGAAFGCPPGAERARAHPPDCGDPARLCTQ